MKSNSFFYLFAILALSLVGCSDSGFDAGKDVSQTVRVDDGVFVDQRDGEKYRVIKVGSDVWMAENLRYKDSTESPNLQGNMWCPDDDPAKCAKFGPLYSWTAARNISSDYSQKTLGHNISRLRGICPDGFRLPTNSDWVYLAMVADKFSGEWTVAEILKAPEGWESWSSDILIYDSTWYSFDALPAGRRNMEGGFLESGLFAFFWTADEIDNATASGWTLRDDNDLLDSGKYYKEHGMSIRCLVENPESVEWKGETNRGGFQFHYSTLEYEGRDYKVLDFGGVTWMAENLNVESENSRCYADKEENCETYGRLYSREDASKVCPEGWRLPTNAEWNNLFYAAGLSATRLMSTEDWHGGNGTDDIGFTALPAGIYDNGSFSDLTISTYFWEADKGNVCSAAQTGVSVNYYNTDLTSNTFSSNTYVSVRCVKLGSCNGL
jgi:uncharacterized protein (TIGR02145 family)